MKKGYQNCVTYRNVVKWWLTGILIFIPFQFQLVNGISGWNGRLALIINRLDEITIIIFFFIAMVELYKNEEIFNPLYIALFIAILGVSIGGLLSGIINGNSPFRTLLGTFDYIKNKGKNR